MPRPPPVDLRTRLYWALVVHTARHWLKDRCLENPEVQAAIAAGLTRVESLERSPVVRLDWRFASVISCVGEGFAANENKNWGEFLGVGPLQPEDPFNPMRILYIYAEDHPYQKRISQRKLMKKRLGRWAKLVNLAYTNTKKVFLQKLAPDEAALIQHRLRLEPSSFWRAAKGKLDLGLKPRVKARQMPLPFLDDPQETQLQDRLRVASGLLVCYH